MKSSEAGRPGVLSLVLGSGFGSGFSPVAPGTAGSLAAIPVIYLVSVSAGTAGLLLLLIFWIAAGLLTAPAFEQHYGPDPSCFVADEWAGQIIPFLTLTFTLDPLHDLVLLGTGFLLFRFFDIVKPLGVKRLERLPSGWGIMTDDLLAGLYALFSLKIVILIV